MSNTERVKERIAKQLNEIARDWNPQLKHYDDLSELPAPYGKRQWLNYANQILADHDILIRSENQELPPVPERAMEHPRMAQARSINAMLKDNWVKCEKKEA